MALFRSEIAEDIGKVKDATALYAVGGGVAFLGAISLCFGIAHLLHWATSPLGTDPASFPLWACHAVVGVALALIGGGLVWSGEMKWKSINPLRNPATDQLKKNV